MVTPSCSSQQDPLDVGLGSLQHTPSERDGAWVPTRKKLTWRSPEDERRNEQTVGFLGVAGCVQGHLPGNRGWGTHS